MHVYRETFELSRGQNMAFAKTKTLRCQLLTVREATGPEASYGQISVGRRLRRSSSSTVLPSAISKTGA